MWVNLRGLTLSSCVRGGYGWGLGGCLHAGTSLGQTAEWVSSHQEVTAAPTLPRTRGGSVFQTMTCSRALAGVACGLAAALRRLSLWAGVFLSASAAKRPLEPVVHCLGGYVCYC